MNATEFQVVPLALSAYFVFTLTRNAFLPNVTAALVADFVSLYECCVVDVDDMEFPYSI